MYWLQDVLVHSSLSHISHSMWGALEAESHPWPCCLCASTNFSETRRAQEQAAGVWWNITLLFDWRHGLRSLVTHLRQHCSFRQATCSWNSTQSTCIKQTVTLNRHRLESLWAAEETRPKPCSFLLMEGDSPAQLRSLPNLLCESRRFCTLPCGLCQPFRVGMYHQTALLTVN